MSDLSSSRWSLKKFITIQPDGTTIEPYGNDPLGDLIYTKDYMTVLVSKNNRKKLESGDVTKATLEEYQSITAHFISYCGKYEFSEDGTIVRHFLDQCSFPNWIGTTQVRNVKIENDGKILILSPVSDVSGIVPKGKSILTWDRVE